MALGQSVTYIDFGLNSVAEFWDRLVVPGVRTFVREPSARTAFDASLSLSSIADDAGRCSKMTPMCNCELQIVLRLATNAAVLKD